MKIEVFFLGTGQAVPTARRNHTAILLRYKNENILFDCGEGTQRQFRKAELNPCKITRIFLSHWHGDHILGLPGLLQTLVLNEYNKKLVVYGPVGTKEYFRKIMSMFIFAGKLNVEVIEINKKHEISFEDFCIYAYNLNHSCPTLGYRFVENDKIRIDKKKLKEAGLKEGPIIGELKDKSVIHIGKKTIKLKDISYSEKGKKIGIIMDTSLTENCYEIGKDADLLISESTYLDEMKDKAEEHKHLTNVQAAEIAKKSRAKKLALIHISQRHELDDKKILNGAKKIFKNSILTEDLMKIEV